MQIRLKVSAPTGRRRAGTREAVARTVTPRDEQMTAAERTELDAAYEAECAARLREALPRAIGVYLVALCFPVVFEAWSHPDRLFAVLSHATNDAAAGLIIALSVGRLSKRTPLVAAGVLFLVLTAVVSGTYNVAVGARAERFVLRQSIILTGGALFLPWGWRPQIVALVGMLAVLAAVGPRMPSADATGYLALVLMMSGLMATAVAWYLDRHRRRAFDRMARDREEAAINSTLLAAARRLAPLDDPAHIASDATAVAVEALECDWSALFAWDAPAQRHRLVACTGLSAPERARVASDPPPPDAAARAPDDPARAVLAGSWGVRALLVQALPAADDRPPLLVCAWRVRVGVLPRRLHRLAGGIAEAAGTALDAARVVADLRRTNRLKSEFVSTMSHELRTPLHVILGCLEMARDPELAGPDHAHALERAERAGRELLTLVESTLDIGRLEAGVDDLQLHAVALPELLAEVRAQCETLPRPAGVVLSWDPMEPSGTIVTDVRKLGAIVRNLVHNALKFTAAGSVSVVTERVDDCLVVRVADTGIGIPADQHDAIFEMFHQADGSDARLYGGTGLGLHIVRRFVDQLAGRIALESTPGRGSTFTVTLPLRGPRGARAVAA
jgi:signal transduction histidine kinase